ncbi:MAG: sigma-70 family RNA polymerase sigma factor [Planctomycetia bacterium]|nr:sigma-70 family RNA polymerase sigma factor [Planctomycetia bacterium]
MAFSEIDRNILERCLQKQPRAWEDFVDRFIGLVYHVIRHTSVSRNIHLSPEDHDELVNEAFAAILADNFTILRRFRGNSSLATYLTVVVRRIVVRIILQKRLHIQTESQADYFVTENVGEMEKRIEDKEEIEYLLAGLPANEAKIVRAYHLEGKSYAQIAQETGVPENTIGPTLSRARAKMRKSAEEH